MQMAKITKVLMYMHVSTKRPFPPVCLVIKNSWNIFKESRRDIDVVKKEKEDEEAVLYSLPHLIYRVKNESL